VFEVRILALIYREIKAIKNGIAGPYLARVRAPETLHNRGKGFGFSTQIHTKWVASLGARSSGMIL